MPPIISNWGLLREGKERRAELVALPGGKGALRSPAGQAEQGGRPGRKQTAASESGRPRLASPPARTAVPPALGGRTDPPAPGQEGVRARGQSTPFASLPGSSGAAGCPTSRGQRELTPHRAPLRPTRLVPARRVVLSQGKAPGGPTPFQVANAAAAAVTAGVAAHPLKTTSGGTIIRRNGSSSRVSTLPARTQQAAAAAAGATSSLSGEGVQPPAGGEPAPPTASSSSSAMGRSESTSSSETSQRAAAASSSSAATTTAGAPLPTPPASFKTAAPPAAAASNGPSAKTMRAGSAASLSTSSSATTLQSATNAVAGPGKTLYCSAECAAADGNNADLASHLSEALHLYSPTSLEPPAWPGAGSASSNGGGRHHHHGSAGGSLPSPFLVSGSDSESGDYFHHHRRLQHLEQHDPSADPLKQPLGFVAHGPGVRRYSARSATTTATTTTTGSSSDSLASLWDPSQPQASTSASSSSAGMAHSASSHGGLRRMTPLHAHATPPLVPLSPIASVPISALSLVAPPASSPLPPSTMFHASPSMSSFDHTSGGGGGGGYSYSSSSSSLASYRSASHPRSAATTGGFPRSSVSAGLQPSLQDSSFSSTATFEPGSAPAAASLYASYAASFQRTPSVEARLASFGSPRRTSTASISSLRSSRLHYPVHGSSDSDEGGGRGRTASGSLSSSNGRLRSRSRASDAGFSEDGGAFGQHGPPHHQITPTGPSLIDRAARPQSYRRPSDASTDGDDGGRSAASSYAAESHLTQQHHQRQRSAGQYPNSRKSVSPPSDREYLSMAPPQSTVRVRPPPAPSRKAGQGSSTTSAADAGWSWGAKEKMYEIPRVTAHLDNLVREGAGGMDPTAGGHAGGQTGSGQRNGSLGKLFYWGA